MLHAGHIHEFGPKENPHSQEHTSQESLFYYQAGDSEPSLPGMQGKQKLKLNLNNNEMERLKVETVLSKFEKDHHDVVMW